MFREQQKQMLEQQRGLMNMYAPQYASMAGMGSTVSHFAHEPAKRDLDTRWEHRMLRLKQKRWAKRRMIIEDAGWYLLLFWGAIGVAGISVAMIGWAVRLVVG
jgi:hypothetical protein